ncbi:exosome complex component RRP45-like [Halichondria panicea]|uniref:exosome complex component RRP45-like n=1 Tax=Halichondria panicea TaxID=6063 RepID=UPI00312BAF80
MNRGKQAPLSLCEKNFMLEAIKESKRLDGREVYDYRAIEIKLGTSPGHVEVMLGDTRVLACVSCRVIRPRPQRPTEGQMHFNVELSPMASPSFEVGRPSSVATVITRTLERCVKESRAVDTESLCIIAGQKVWEVRVDVHVLDHCGNIIDCAAIATLTALKHFRRPDVTVIGEEATIHPVTERDPVPLSVHHMPLCFTFAFFHGGERLLVDPSLSEEGVMEGQLVIAMNVHREICALQMTGGVAIEQDQVMRCTQIAAVKCIELTEVIKKALSRSNFKTSDESSILRTKQPESEVSLPECVDSSEGVMEVEEVNSARKPEVVVLDDKTAELGMGGANTWDLAAAVNKNWRSSDDETPQPQHKSSKNNTKKKSKKKKLVEVARDSGSEEEETMTITSADIGVDEASASKDSDVMVVEDVGRNGRKKRKGSLKSTATATAVGKTTQRTSSRQKKQKK